MREDCARLVADKLANGKEPKEGRQGCALRHRDNYGAQAVVVEEEMGGGRYRWDTSDIGMCVKNTNDYSLDSFLPRLRLARDTRQRRAGYRRLVYSPYALDRRSVLTVRVPGPASVYLTRSIVE